jgi:hypothetical protein
MAGVITSGNWPKALREGVRKFTRIGYGDGTQECRTIFHEVTSDRAYEEWVAAQGFGLPQATAAGAPTPYDSHAQGYTTRLRPIDYRLGFAITANEVADNLYPRLMASRGRTFGKSFREMEELLGAAVLNNAFDSAHVWGDGIELCATTHPSTGEGTFANEPAAAVDFDEAAVEDMWVLIKNTNDDRGINANLKPRRLVVPDELAFDAVRFYESDLQSGNANNDVNAAKMMKIFPDGVFNYHYLTDADAFFIQTDLVPDEGLIYLNRQGFRTSRDNEFDTDNMKTKGHMRIAFGAVNPHAIYGSPGA